MEEQARETGEATTKAKWSEAAGQAILLTAAAWALFILIQAPWYMQTFHVQPYGVRWLVVTLITGAVPTLIVLLLAFLLSWLIGIVRRRPDPWRSYRAGLIVACVFTILANFALFFGQSH